MSTLIVEVCEVLEVERHPHADRLAIATVKGWKTSIGYNSETGKEQFEPGDKCVYFPWKPLTDEMKVMLEHLSGGGKNIIVFGEIYGSGMQDMRYGLENGRYAFRVFDINVDGKYLDYEEKMALCRDFGIPMAPVLYRGPYSRAIVEEFTNGPTTLCDPALAGRFKGREGIVITPARERWSEHLLGRAILKSVSADCIARKGGTDAR